MRGPCTETAAPGFRATTRRRSATKPGSALWPEKSTSFTPLSVIWSNTIAIVATTRPTSGMITNGFFGTSPAVARPSRRTGMVTTAAARPITMAQPIWPQVGWENAERCNGVSEYALVLRPVQSPMPMNTSDPMPAAIRPGSTISGSVAPPKPAASITRIAATIGEPKIAEMAAKPPAAPEHDEQLRGRVLLGQVHGEHRQASTERDERSFGAEHQPETNGRERGQHDARHHVRLGGPHLEAVRGDVAPVPRKARDRKRDRKAGEEEHG